MNHHVSPETALKLKEAGYPQPETTNGLFLDGFGHATKDPYCDTDSLAYMPTATEIMEQPEMNAHRLYFDDKKWVVVNYAFKKNEHENPAEAAAEMYLKIKGQ